MNFTRLRIAGFKTFVDPTDAPIEPGLTGIVGPNGCGKSNLIEAMRWVMGESSHKSMRAAGMEDVIFAGSTSRPARNHAEVSLTLDNSAGLAPAPFDRAAEIEVSRKISRGLGSIYRINGREARARDVQLLFADASSGARSPSMVGQGRVGEIINARPDQRRRILEEAAGIAGLYARRGEAENRLEGAEQNLARVTDVLARLGERAEALRKQARAAERYRALTQEIGAVEGFLLLARHMADAEGARAAERAETEALGDASEAARAQSQAAHGEAVANQNLGPARRAAADAEAALRYIAHRAGELEGEEARARARLSELDARLAQVDRDCAREATLAADSDAARDRVAAALERLGKDCPEELGQDAAAGRLAAAETAAAAAEAAFAEATQDAATRLAERRDLERRRDEQAERLARLDREAQALEGEAATLAAEAAREGDVAALGLRHEAARSAFASEERALASAEAELASARAAETEARRPAAEATSRAERAVAEARTLAKLVADDPTRRFPPAVDLLVVDPGFETALGAALGDDLDASVDPRAQGHWAGADPTGDAALPEGVASLAERIVAPPELVRRLRQIGVVAREDGARLRVALKPGQKLVSREGDLWRWDGLTLPADAPTPAARRLAERNRLGAVERSAADARAEADRLRASVERARERSVHAANAERAAREAERAARSAMDSARESYATAERAASRLRVRVAANDEARGRISALRDEADGARAEAVYRLGALPEDDRGEALAKLKAAAGEARRAAASVRAEVDAGAAIQLRETARRAELAADAEAWSRRRADTEARLRDLATRRVETTVERESLVARPDEIASERRGLRGALGDAEAASRAAADRLAAAERGYREADRAARVAAAALARTREEVARAGARLEAAREKLTSSVERIMAARGLTPQELTASLAGVARPAPEELQARLARAVAARERLGPVNLRAEQDLAEAEAAGAELAAEREDLAAAIQRLRAAVRSLNQEGRARLLAAFERVDGHFRKLFEKLFEGGEARLELIESDDPLEAGLEVVARPPGKKAQTLSLLSGGEQALTALALVFAVFLTNPAPVCVLDEVDAPLDDANVERFCALLAEMSAATSTRFLTITHNPITMAHMHRLLGVTMSERGVSQLVSVDLQAAERLAEAV